MAMRKKTAKELAQKRAARRARKEVASNPHDDMRYFDFGVARVNGRDAVFLIGNALEDGDSYEQNSRKFMAEVDEAKEEGRFEAYINLFRLYEDGRAQQRYKAGDGSDSAYEAWYEQTTRRFQELVEGEFDKVFPEFAAEMKSYVQDVVSAISKKVSIPIQLPEGGSINPECLTEHIRGYLQEAKKQIMETGVATGVIGWGVDTGIISYPAGLPKEKYRFARAVSEIASIINAPLIMHGSEAWLRDKDTMERTGDELVQAYIISPDGSVVASGILQFRRIDCPLTFKEMTLETAKGKQSLKQFMFPKWAYFPTPATVAA
jgi:hypothetical protein